jgi:hypothetical protein
MGRGRSATTTALLSRARDILERIQPCSVRAVAYQLFTHGLIPSMATPRRIGSPPYHLGARGRRDSV